MQSVRNCADGEPLVGRRVRTTAGTAVGAFSVPARFKIGPRIIIQAPQPLRPAQNAIDGVRPALLVANSDRTGPAGSLSYRFDLATDPVFGSFVATATVPEMPIETRFTPPTDLTSGLVFYWRVQASDPQSGAVSDYTPVQSFRTQIGQFGGSFVFTLRTVNPCDGVSPAFPGTYALDGLIKGVGNQFSFTADRALPGGPPQLVVDATRIGDTLTGSGGAFDAVGYFVSVAKSLGSSGPAPLFGRVTTATTMNGPIDGYIGVVHPVFGLATGCAGTHTWTLTSQ